MERSPLLVDLREIIRRSEELSREFMSAVSGSHRRMVAAQLLNMALAAQFVCFLQMRRQALMATIDGPSTLVQHLESFAAEDLEHTDRIATRIHQLSGTPQFGADWMVSPRTTRRQPLARMVHENAQAKLLAAGSLRGIADKFDGDDSISHHLLSDIHASVEKQVLRMEAIVRQLSGPQGTTLAENC